jgi:chromatin segregation and condensation protein Rec8/ScpA/Scc1 (kleisin family)
MEKLKNLFSGNRTRSEIVATFLAILDLCKTGTAALEGDISGENPDVRLIEKERTGGESGGTN